MNVTRKTLKPKSIPLAVIMFPIGDPINSVLTAMIGTVTLMDSARDQEPANISTSSRLAKIYRMALSPRVSTRFRQGHELTV